jgi:hypothetical protein
MVGKLSEPEKIAYKNGGGSGRGPVAGSAGGNIGKYSIGVGVPKVDPDRNPDLGTSGWF